MANMSEDALFKALLKNKPPQQPPKPMVAQSIPRKEVPGPAAAPPVERYQEEPVIEPKIIPVVQPVNLEPVVDSINRLNSSINMIQGMVKTIITPILILILIVSIGILVQGK